MKLAIQIPRFVWPDAPIGQRLVEVGRAAEAAGLSTLWVMDHFFQIPPVGPIDEPMLEAYATLSFLAAATSTIRLGTMVTGVTYRSPGILIKQVTTLDVLSGGRAYLGIGAGWYEREHRGLGVPFPPLKERFERLEETLQIAHQMWRGDTRPFTGRHYQLAEPLNVPAATAQPHPPILVGGGGEQKTLRLVARYADACNLFGALPKDQLAHKLDVLRGYCQQEGRDYDQLDRTALVQLDVAAGQAGIDSALRGLDQLAELGFTSAIYSIGNTDILHTIDVIGRHLVSHAAGARVSLG